MKKQTTTKIILGMIIFAFVVFIFHFSSPTQAATTSSISSLYANPNQGGNNTYKFKVSDVINSSLLTNIVGCTGVVNKVATWMTNFLQSPAKQLLIKTANAQKVRDQLKSACASTKAGVQGGVGTVINVNDLVSAITTMFSKINMKVDGMTVKACQDQVSTTNDDALLLAQQSAQQDTETNLRTQCFDGIAITLAKNQLTSMTKSMMNWVNTGYGGNPFFVRNMQDLANNINRNVLTTGIDILLSPGTQSPYAQDFATSAMKSNSLLSSPTGLLSSLQSSLENFITDPKSYYTNGQLDLAQETRTALQRAQDANNAFAKDFSVGGWDGWLALTQIDQNNPLGYTMQASDYVANQQAAQLKGTQDEVMQNGGFLSQKTCIKWDKYDAKGPIALTTELATMGVFETSKTKTSIYDQCDPDGWQTITPGSLIKDKASNYLNSPERQLELAKTINDSLNALFSVLIDKLEGGGLAGLSDSAQNNTNWTDNNNMNVVADLTSSDGNSTYSNNGAYDGFNLTKDLGNTYLHVTPVSLGTWDAKNNSTSDGQKLYPDTGPTVLDASGNPASNDNTYYTVNTEGQTKLIVDGYNGWAVGDRAFWDGTKWQNWKCGGLDAQGQCTGQANPIKNRGVIQIQQDYIVAAKEILKVLPNVMPKLGELDYCIPGPNPSYKINSTDAQAAYQDWTGSMYVGVMDSTGERYGVKIDDVGSRTYENLHSIHMENSAVWTEIQKSMEFLMSTFSNICNDDNGWLANLFGGSSNCSGDYFYAKNGNLSKGDSIHLQEKTDIMDANMDYVNSNLFQNFYELFDKMMNKLYFNNITQKYLSTETSTDLVPNPDYVPMAESGYNLTKDMVYYNDDNTKAIQDYSDAIKQAKVNIAALNPIEAEVSSIIKAAQDRRNQRLVGTLGLTLAQIQDKYKDCFAEENIQFYDADTVTNTGSTAVENCNDGIDNDMNGLIDAKDPACQSVIGTTNTGNTGTVLPSYYYEIKSCSGNQTYETGPYPIGTYSSGSRVQGATNAYYVVTNFGTSPITGITNIETTSTETLGCPQ